MSVGFIHGVMNTDNMAIAGETIDYGPCAFMDAYNPGTVFSSIDHYGRYAYGNQPKIAQWNLTRFAETLIPLLATDQTDAVNQANEALHQFDQHYQQQHSGFMRLKLGLGRNRSRRLSDAPHDAHQDDTDDDTDQQLIDSFLALIKNHKVDYTLACRQLGEALENNPDTWLSLFNNAAGNYSDAQEWLAQWRQRLHNIHPAVPASDIASGMHAVNPWIVPRNHLVEEAIHAAYNGNLAPFNRLLDALQTPFDRSDQFKAFSQPAPESFTAKYQTFCGT